MPGAYIAQNLIDADATLTPSSEDTYYPVENIYDSIAANVFRSGSQTTLSIIIDLGASESADTIALINHNLTNAATIALKNGDNSPATSITTLSYRANDIWKAFASVSVQSWVLEITDTNPEDIEIGQIVLGTRVQFPRGRRIGHGYKPKIKRFHIEGETYAGVKHVEHVNQIYEFNPVYRITANELAVFLALDTLTIGNKYPFVYIPDDTGDAVYYVRKQTDMEPTEIAKSADGIIYEYELFLAEETRGTNIAV